MLGDLIRQGDVLLERIEAVPEGMAPAASEGGRYVLEHGEVTGHAHAVLERDAVVYGTPAAGQVVEVLTPTPLTHEEHGPHDLEGVWDRWVQEEYDGEEERRVLD